MLDLTGGSVLSGLTKVKDSVLFDSLVSSECGVLKLWSSLEKKQQKKQQWLLWTNKHKDFFVLVLI